MMFMFNQTTYNFSAISHTASLFTKFQTNSIVSSTKESVSLEDLPVIKATFISLYALIFFFGISGNALVVRKYPSLFFLPY